jgi:hypothetical protein
MYEKLKIKIRSSKYSHGCVPLKGLAKWIVLGLNKNLYSGF